MPSTTNSGGRVGSGGQMTREMDIHALKIAVQTIEELKAERDRYKAALEEIAKHPRHKRYDPKGSVLEFSDALLVIAQQALAQAIK
jgi:hypothetical protein